MTKVVPSGAEQFEGGYLPLSAERIEARLAEVWEEASGDDSRVGPAVKLCLSNILLFTDSGNRSKTEQLARNIAQRLPSRLLMVVVDDKLDSYGAFVSTSCSLSHSTGFYTCYEIVELLSSPGRIADLPGAIRSLLVESVPVVIIDVIDWSETLAPLKRLHKLAETLFGLNSAVTPGQNIFVPFEWYATAATRQSLGEIIADMFGSADGPAEIMIEFSETVRGNITAELIYGWVMARLDKWGAKQNKRKVTFEREGKIVQVKSDVTSTNENLIRISSQGGELATIRSEPETGSWVPGLVFSSETLATGNHDTEHSLCEYILANSRIGNEFHEYREAVAILNRNR